MMRTGACLWVVDDRALQCKLICRDLIKAGYQVELLQNPLEALLKLEDRVPDLILMTVELEVISGVELCRRIKAQEKYQNLPIILLGDHDESETLKRCFGVGAVDFLMKPLKRVELLTRVQSHLEMAWLLNRHMQIVAESHRTLRMIANGWLGPLQRLAPVMRKMQEQVGLEDKTTRQFYEQEIMRVERMASSVEQFLDLKSTSHRIEPVDAQHLVVRSTSDLNRLFGRWYATAKRKSINFQIDHRILDHPIVDHPCAVSDIVDAILSNALLYTPTGGEVTVRIQKNAGRVELVVADNGPGFPLDYFKQEFQPFVRTVNGQKDVMLGMGLVIAKSAADRLDADLEIRNRTTGGAKVCLRFARQEEVYS